MTENINPDHMSTNCHCGSALPGGRTLVNLDEAAPRLGMNIRQLRGYVRGGQIQHRKRGGRYFLLWPDDFDKFVDSIVEPVR